MSLRTTLILNFLLFLFNYGFSQLSDDFSDTNFTVNPTWSGTEENFVVDTVGQLQLNAPEAGYSYLSTPSKLVNNTLWEFYLEMDFYPSSTSYVKVYILSDQEDISGPLEGYFVKVGDTEDEISLYYQSGTTEIKIIDGLDDVVDVSSPNVRIKVHRNAEGKWLLYYDSSGGFEYILAGSTSNMNSISGDYFGIYCKYIASRKKDFFFDDFSIEQVQIDSIVILDSQNIHVYFNQPIDQSIAESQTNYSIADLVIESITQVDTNQVILTIDEETPLQTNEYLLEIGSSLTLNASTSLSFSYHQLDLLEILTLSETEIQLIFNDDLDSINTRQISNYSINNGIGQPTSTTLLDDTKSVTLELDNPLAEGVDYQLTINDIFNHLQNSTLNTVENFDFVIPLILDSVIVLNSSEVLAVFNKPLDGVSANTNSNYKIGSVEADLATLQPNDSSILLTFPFQFDDINYDLDVSNVQDASGNLIQISSSTASFEYLNLAVSSISQEDQKSIRITFNQAIDPLSSLNATSYVLSEGVSIIDISYSSQDSSMLIEADRLYNTTHYLSIQDIFNGSMNSTLFVESLPVNVSVQTEERTLIINEVMADPTPVVGMPDAEYVEVFNRSGHSINLQNFTLNGEPFPAFTLLSDDYVVLTDDSDLGLFAISNILGFSSFDALTNTGEAVVLKDQFGYTIDSLYYNFGWYQDDLKDQGGYSLELINPNQPCSDQLNWKASSAEEGGTPGRENSVFDNSLDALGPELTNVTIHSADSILLQFSEPIEVFDPSNIEFDGQAIDLVSKVDFGSFWVTLASPITSEIDHTLLLKSVKDCFGNESVDLMHEIYFDKKPPVFKNIIILSDQEVALAFHEELNEPDAEKEAHFLIDDSLVQRAILQDSTNWKIHLSVGHKFIEGKNYELIVFGLTDTLENQIDTLVTSFTYQDQIDTAIVSANNVLNLYYKVTPEIASAVTPKNYYLAEENQFPSEVLAVNGDPNQYRLVFKESFDENDEMLIYMNGINGQNGETLKTPAQPFIYDTRPPDLEKLIVLNDSQLVLLFDEPLDLSAAIPTPKYQWNNEIPAEVIPLTENSIKLIFNKGFPEEQMQTLRFKKLSDLSGNIMARSKSVDFVFDQKAPVLLSAFMLSERLIQLDFSEKLEFEMVSNLSNYSVDNLHPDSLFILGPDSTQIQLYFSSLPEMAFEIQCDSATDQQQNTSIQQAFAIDPSKPLISRFMPISDSILYIKFNQPMGSSAYAFDNFMLNGFKLIEIEQIGASELLVYTDEHFLNGDSLILQPINVKSGAGNNLDSGAWVVFQDHLLEVIISDPKTISLIFDTPIASLNRDYFQIGSGSIQSVIPDSKNGTELTLLLSDSIPENETINLVYQPLLDKYSRTLPGKRIPLLVDTHPPSFKSINHDFLSKIEVSFSELLDPQISTSSLFEVIGIGEPIYSDVQDSTLLLDFSDQLVLGSNYQLLIKSISDLVGNFLSEDTIAFTYNPPDVAPIGSIIFNELMIDPTPSEGLPEVEFIELFNVSDEDVNLGSLVLMDNSTQVNLPDFTLPANEYVILTAIQNISLFTNENVLGVDEFPSLTNSGEKLELQTINGISMDVVSYRRDWYHNTDRDDGGFSLELVNPYSECPGIINWRASESSIGGTPGKENSIFNLEPDSTAPEILTFELIDDQSIRIVLSEGLDSLSATESNLKSPFILTSKEVKGIYYDTLLFHLNQPLPSGKLHEFQLSGVSDCSGNKREPFTFTLGIGRTADYFDLLITEIMADPEPSFDLPVSEYLEIYNITDDLISLKGVGVADDNDTTYLPATIIGAHEYLLLTPNSSSASFNMDNSLALSNWVSLSNSSETIRLVQDEKVIHQVSYDTDWHEMEKRDGGFSLEMRDLSNPCAGRINWGSTMANGGTPGESNSNSESVPDHLGPNLLQAISKSEDSIQLVFDEPLFPDAVDHIKVSIDPAIPIATIWHRPFDYTTIDLTMETDLQVNRVYEVLISNVNDCLNNPIQKATTNFVLADQPDSLMVVINEVLFNPRENGVDFVEIYNNSESYLDLKGWSLGRLRNDEIEDKLITEKQQLIAPHSYIALAMDTLTLKNHYPKTGSLFQASGFPTYPNDEGTVILLDPIGNSIDQFTYSDEMHLSLMEDVEGVSLERLSVSGPSQDHNNWRSAASSAGFATPGFANSQAFESVVNGQLTIAPKIFVPGSSNTSHQSFTTINYQLQHPGQFANVMIYNQNGQPIDQLANGMSLSIEGFLRWDGTNASGRVVKQGYYVVLFEIYDGSGNQEVLKETVVVGRE